MNEKVSMEGDGKHISGRYAVEDGIVTVTAGVIEDSMLSPETLARVLLLQLHRACSEARGITVVAQE
jgi:hypothetical protein